MKKHENGQIDWAAIEVDYITSNSSMDKLRKKYEIGVAAIKVECAKKGWVEKRKQYQQKLVQQACQKQLKKDVGVLQGEIEGVNNLSDSLCKALADPEFLFMHTISIKDNDETWLRQSIKLETLNTAVMKDVTVTLDKLVNLKAMLHKVLDENDKQRIELEREKFEHTKAMDQARMEMDRERLHLSNDKDDEGTGVIILPARLPHE